MNAAQRYSNRATAQEARRTIHRRARPLWPWQTLVLTDFLTPWRPSLPVTSDQWFADALDSLWMADSIDDQNAAIRLALSNRLSDHGWRGNPTPCWPESTRIAYCRQQGLPTDTPEETCRRLQRYGFLTSYAARNDAEQDEMGTLRAALLAEGIDPGWEEVPRRETTDEDLAVFQIREERA